MSDAQGCCIILTLGARHNVTPQYHHQEAIQFRAAKKLLTHGIRTGNLLLRRTML